MGLTGPVCRYAPASRLFAILWGLIAILLLAADNAQPQVTMQPRIVTQATSPRAPLATRPISRPPPWRAKPL